MNKEPIGGPFDIDMNMTVIIIYKGCIICTEICTKFRFRA